MGVQRLLRDRAPLHLQPGPWPVCPVCLRRGPLYRSARYGEPTDHCWHCHSHRRKRHLAALVTASLREGSRLLEIAPGGQLSAALGRRHRGYVPLRYPPYSADDLPLRDACFDVVVSCDVIEHFLHPEACLRELLRVLRPGGAHFSSVLVEEPSTRYGGGAVLGNHLDEDGGDCPVYTRLGDDLAAVVEGWLQGTATVELSSGVLIMRRRTA